MNKNHIDSDLAQAGTALKRAAQRAREMAERTNTPLITYKDGHVRKTMMVKEASDKTYK
jgi:hypothetical protein